MKGLDLLSNVYRNLRRGAVLLFFVTLTSGVEVPKEQKQVAKCSYATARNLERELSVSSENQSSIRILKFFGYYSVSDNAVDKTNDEDYPVFENEISTKIDNGQHPKESLDEKNTIPVAKFSMKPVVNYTVASVLASEQAIAANGDETAEKLLRILKAVSLDKNTPFKSSNVHTIQFQQPVTHSQIIEISCQLILWHKFNSLATL